MRDRFALLGVNFRLSKPDVTPGEVGELFVKGDVFKGYWKDPNKTKECFWGDWFKTGDLGYQDPNDDLRLYLVGRSTGMIISGGYNIYPKEIENILEKHKGVKEAAVIGLPDQDFGERVEAAVVLEDNSAEVTEERLKEICKTALTSYKCPKKIHFFREIPKNAMGKVLKEEVKNYIMAGVTG